MQLLQAGIEPAYSQRRHLKTLQLAHQLAVAYSLLCCIRGVVHLQPSRQRSHLFARLYLLYLLQVGDEVGADCSILGSLDDPSAPNQKATVIKQRFQVSLVLGTGALSAAAAMASVFTP